MAEPSWTDEELDRRHDEVVARYPGGLTTAQFRLVALESVRDDGIVHFPNVEFIKGMSIIIGMHLADLVHRPGGHHAKGPYFITEKGREYLAAAQSEKR